MTPVSRNASRALSKAAITCAAALCASAGLTGGQQSRAAVPPYFDIAKLGDPALKNTAGNRSFPAPTLMNSVGQVVANQTAYDPSGNPIGQYAWFLEDGSLTRIGLFDGAFQSDHTSPWTNEQVSNVQLLTNTGYAGGFANLYVNQLQTQTLPTGRSAWVYNHNSSDQQKNKRVGLIDGVHITTNAQQVSALVALNDSGVAAGNSERYSGNTSFGYSAFIHKYDELDATPIGLGLSSNDDGNDGSLGSDLEHVQVTGPAPAQRTVENNVRAMNNAGDVVGTATRYNGGTTAVGNTLWLRAADGTIEKLGYADTNDAEHTRSSNQRKENLFVALNADSTVAGHQTRYQGLFTRGQTAWIQGSTLPQTGPIRLGFITDVSPPGGPADIYNSSTTARSSTIERLTDNNYASGYSVRYGAGGTGDAGQAAWIYSVGNGVQEVGFKDDDDHRGTVSGVANYRHSSVKVLTKTGYAAGESYRFDKDTNVREGMTAWLQKDGDADPTRIGLYDNAFATDHTKDDGTQNSTIVAMNDFGDAVGHSSRFNNANNAGQSAWIYNGSGGSPTNTRIGLFDSTHTASDGFTQSSTVQFVNSAGQAAGISERFGTATDPGDSGWFYDGTTTVPLVFSTSGNGEAHTTISFLSDLGIVLGTYTDYSDGGATVPFLWDSTRAPADRFARLEDLVIDGNGWATLNQVLKMSQSGHILGTGTITTNGGGAMPFVLTPVPEPAGLALLATTGVLMLPRRRRRSS